MSERLAQPEQSERERQRAGVTWALADLEGLRARGIIGAETYNALRRDYESRLRWLDAPMAVEVTTQFLPTDPAEVAAEARAAAPEVASPAALTGAGRTVEGPDPAPVVATAPATDGTPEQPLAEASAPPPSAERLTYPMPAGADVAASAQPALRAVAGTPPVVRMDQRFQRFARRAVIR